KQRKMLETLHREALEGRKVLIVDDDIRNIFAMTSVLERFKMRVVSAENGKDGIQLLLDNKDIDIVLMDIMLPTMDGYTTIRGRPRSGPLPARVTPVKTCAAMGRWRPQARRRTAR